MDYLTSLFHWKLKAEETGVKYPLPSDEELLQFSEDPRKDFGEQPALIQVWESALQYVVLLQDTDNIEVLDDPDPDLLFQPDLDVLLRAMEQGLVMPPTESAAPSQPAHQATPGPAHQDARAPREEKPSRWESVAAQSAAALGKVGAFTRGERSNDGSQHGRQSETSGAHAGQAYAGQPSARQPGAGHGAAAQNFTGQRSPEEDYRDYASREFFFDDWADAEKVPGAEFRVTDLGDGLRLKWDIPEQESAPVSLFRVISDEAAFTKDPNEGEQRIVTVGTQWVDEDEIVGVNRYYQVWVHQGDSETSALKNQPRLVGEGVHVRPIDSIELTYDGHEIRGQWELAEGTDKVLVYVAKIDERNFVRSKYQQETDKRNERGFRYVPLEKGQRYKVCAVREISYSDPDGKELRPFRERSAESAVAEIMVPAEVENIRINVQRPESERQVFNVTWDKPSSGEVRIYTTRSAPTEGIQNRTVELEQLDPLGLPKSNWHNYDSGGLRCAVEWPEGWYSLFITPVHVVGNECQVGESEAFVRVGELENVELLERVSSQLVSFGWPEEAQDVYAFATTAGEGEFFQPSQGHTPIASIASGEYKDNGGMRLAMQESIDLVLVPVRTYRGQLIWGPKSVVPYRGLREFRYNVELHPDGGRAAFSVIAEKPMRDDFQFTLRYLPDRLPLEHGDGIEVLLSRPGNDNYQGSFSDVCSYGTLDPSNSEGIFWEIDPAILHRGSGFIRLFFRNESLPDSPEYVLLDPPLRKLDLSQLMRGNP